jgi:hypothetical protein
MSITYGAVNSDRLTIAASSSINNLTAWANIAWYRPTSFGGGGLRVWAKQLNGGGGAQRHAGIISNSSGALAHEASRVTTNSTCTSSTVLGLGRWQCVAFTYDETDGTRIFVGTESSPMQEVLYSARAAGSGATQLDDTKPLYFANRDTFTSAYIGQIEEQAHFGRRLSLDEMCAWQRQPYIGDARVYIHHGMSGVGVGTQIDLTGNGNHGTITGPTVPSFERLERISLAQVDCDDDMPGWRFDVVAAGGGGAFVKITGNRQSLAGPGGLAA